LLTAAFPQLNAYEAKRLLQVRLLKRSVSLKPKAKKLCA